MLWFLRLARGNISETREVPRPYSGLVKGKLAISNARSDHLEVRFLSIICRAMSIDNVSSQRATK